MRSFIRAPSHANAFRQTKPTVKIGTPGKKITEPKAAMHPSLRLAEVPLQLASSKRVGSAAGPSRHALPILQRRADGLGRDQGPSNFHVDAQSPNRTGLPDRLKANVEAMSGLSMNDVRVHRNSPKPAQVRALAYARGTEIHLGPGQERHLPHETWHVVQQKQGRVKPMLQKRGMTINDDDKLENEADAKGVTMAGAVIQKVGEPEAVKSTRGSNPIRRGNRRDSVIDTGGESTALLDAYRNSQSQMIAFVKNEMVKSKKYNAQEADEMLSKVKFAFIDAEAVRNISVGNCGEFANVVYADLVQNNSNQYVYRCHLDSRHPADKMLDSGTNNYDHAFTITYEQKVNYVKDFDETKAFVADAWDGYKILTLGQFMNKRNALGVKLGSDDIIIDHRDRATGKQILNDDVKKYIREWAIKFVKDFRDEIIFAEAFGDTSNPSLSSKTQAYKDARSGARFYETRGSDVQRDVRDVRPGPHH